MERGVLVQRSMSPRHIIIGGISAYDLAQVRFAKHDHVVETFAADEAETGAAVILADSGEHFEKVAARRRNDESHERH